MHVAAILRCRDVEVVTSSIGDTGSVGLEVNVKGADLIWRSFAGRNVGKLSDGRWFHDARRYGQGVFAGTVDEVAAREAESVSRDGLPPTTEIAAQLAEIFKAWESTL